MSGISKAEVERRLKERDADYYADLTGYPPPGGVSRQDRGMGFLYTPDPYPTKDMAPARYDPGEDHPFGFDPEGYTGDPLLKSEPEEKVKMEEEEEDQMPKGSNDPPSPESTGTFGQSIPRPAVTSLKGYGTVSPYDQLVGKESYIGGAGYGSSAVNEFAGLLAEVAGMTGYSPRTGRRNVARYPSLFDYV